MKVKHVSNHWLPKLIGARAITIYPYVFYADEKISSIIYIHEMVHVKQIEQDGFFKFYTLYLFYYLKNRYNSMTHKQAYLNVPYEIEARKATQNV